MLVKSNLPTAEDDSINFLNFCICWKRPCYKCYKAATIAWVAHLECWRLIRDDLKDKPVSAAIIQLGHCLSPLLGDISHVDIGSHARSLFESSFLSTSILERVQSDKDEAEALNRTFELPPELRLQVARLIWPDRLQRPLVSNYHTLPLIKKLCEPASPRVVSWDLSCCRHISRVQVVGKSYIAAVLDSASTETKEVVGTEDDKVVIMHDELGIVDVQCTQVLSAIHRTRKNIWYSVYQNASAWVFHCDYTVRLCCRDIWTSADM